jgi:hypothetical protein
MFAFILISVVKFWPWRISVAGFLLSAMANFMKDGGVVVPYSDMLVPHVGRYARILALRHDLPSAMDNIGSYTFFTFLA